MSAMDAFMIVWAIAVAAWLAHVWATIGQHPRRAPRAISRKIPTRENPAPMDKYLQLEALSNVRPADYRAMAENLRTINLAHRMGCDITIHRDGGKNEWLICGDDPTAKRGFIVIHNGDV